MIKIVFFGTPEYVIPILKTLHKKFKGKNITPISAVVTKRPTQVGRKKILTFSPVDTWAHKRGIPVVFDSRDILKNNIKADLGVLASYGAIIPKEIINYFPRGIIVVHPSLLPQFRWGSPVPAAIVTNTNPTGVTFIKMDEHFDHGQIISQFKEEILPDDTYESLRNRLFAKSAEVLASAIPAYLSGKIKLKPQDDTKATFARMIVKKDAFIPPEFLDAALQGERHKNNWEISFIKNYSLAPSASSLERFIRAMQPWPVAWTEVSVKYQGSSVKKRLKILRVHTENKKLILDEVQLEGKNPVTWKQFKAAYNIQF